MSQRTHRFRRSQWVDLPVEDAFACFSDMHHLAQIAPPFLQLTWVTDPDRRIEPGLLLDYQVRIYGVSFPWRTRILNVDPPHAFAYEQAEGPVKSWVHGFLLHAEEGGTRLVDDVSYEVGFGLPGALGHRAFGRGLVEAMFDHRAAWIASLRGEVPLW